MRRRLFGLLAMVLATAVASACGGSGTGGEDGGSDGDGSAEERADSDLQDAWSDDADDGSADDGSEAGDEDNGGFCETDNDCCPAKKCEPFLCIQNRCRPVGKECSKTEECDGLGCRDRACQPCGFNPEACGAGFICDNPADQRSLCLPGDCNPRYGGNSDCGGGQVCIGTWCSPCPDDESCGEGRICEAEACILGNCHTTADCSGGKVCLSRYCSDCSQDSQCLADQLCASGKCVIPECYDRCGCLGDEVCKDYACGPCATSGDCGAGQVCDGGHCFRGDCASQADCAEGLACADHVCTTANFAVPATTTVACMDRIRANTVLVEGFLSVESVKHGGSGFCRIDADSIVVTASGSIVADGAGYESDEGPGAGCPAGAGSTASGGGHGAAGGKGCSAQCTTNGAYGAEGSPDAELGSGGGSMTVSRAGYPDVTFPGGSGGGAIVLDAGTITIDGMLSADAEHRFPTGRRNTGGGAGGSVVLRARDVSLHGTVSAVGGTGSCDDPAMGSTSAGGSGAGGRIKVFYTATLDSTGAVLKADGGPNADVPCTACGLGGSGSTYLAQISGCTGPADCAGGPCSNGICRACSQDGQCAAGRVCVLGRCVECLYSCQCPAGKVCVAGTCGPCSEDSQCRHGEICETGTCVAGNCHDSGDCLGGLTCVNRFCAPCTSNAQCLPGLCSGGLCRCDQTLCVNNKACGADADCLPGGQCAFGSCHCGSPICVPGDGCMFEGDCGAGHCISEQPPGMCRCNPPCPAKECTIDEDCGAGNTCFLPPPSRECECLCRNGLTCLGGVCDLCTRMQDCPWRWSGTYQACIDQRCQPCASDTDCEKVGITEYTCSSGACRDLPGRSAR